MAATEQELRNELREERARLAEAVQVLREELGRATDVSGKLRAKLPVAAAGAFGLGFVTSGGIGATVRLVFRRGREGTPQVTVGRYRLVDRG